MPYSDAFADHPHETPTMHCRAALSFASCLSVAAALVSALPATAQPVKKTADIEYVRIGDKALQLDLYQPDGVANAPLLVWVHGGAWEAGSKSPMPATALVEHGYAIASVDFRPASAAVFPGQVHDLKAAIRFLRATAATYGYDAERIGILGASSGAHLAVLVATTHGSAELEGTLGEHGDESSAVQAIVSYFGASNLTTILAQSTPFGVGIRTPALKRLLGALPEENVTLARLASPVFHVDANDPPLLLLHGDQDPQMPINQSHELPGAYEQLGLMAVFIVLHGAAQGGDAFFAPHTVESVAAFHDTHLRR
jgi:acetyl esterase/lipase